jgi:indole-3-glycerol phosphate synthase
MGLLEDILATKRREIAELRGVPRRSRPREPIAVIPALRRARGEALRLIAEVKLRSPSAGPLSRAMTPPQRALAYAEAGASMVSVLCDAPYFDGSWDHLDAARRALDEAGVRVPVLAKDFVLDERQIEHARDSGADAVLLIARIVSGGRLAELAAAARNQGVEPLVEVIDEVELAAAVAAGARLVGVNARDLDTLAMDAPRTARVLAAIAPETVAVHLSGLRDTAAITHVAAGRADAALVGEALMRADDPRPLLRAMAASATQISN